MADPNSNVNNNSELRSTFAELRSKSVDSGVGHLVLINGGAAIALLAFLQAVWEKSPDLSAIVLIPITVFACGAAAAGCANFLRYNCSLSCEQQVPGNKELETKYRMWETWSWRIQWLAVLLFALGSVIIATGTAVLLCKTLLQLAVLMEILVAVIGGVAIYVLLRRVFPRK